MSFIAIGSVYAQESPAHVTILYDAFGKPSNLKRGWGYSALVEYSGKRILFDTGSDAARTLHGQFAFAEFIRVYGSNFDHAGLGSVIALPL